MDEQLKQIANHPQLLGVMLWPHEGGFLGSLIDWRGEQMTSTTPWQTLPTVQDVINHLVESAKQIPSEERKGANSNEHL